MKQIVFKTIVLFGLFAQLSSIVFGGQKPELHCSSDSDAYSTLKIGQAVSGKGIWVTVNELTRPEIMACKSVGEVERGKVNLFYCNQENDSRFYDNINGYDMRPSLNYQITVSLYISIDGYNSDELDKEETETSAELTSPIHSVIFNKCKSQYSSY